MSRRHTSETVLSTGWRIVGRDADAIAARAAQASIASMTPAAETEALYAVQITMPVALRGRPSVELILDAINDDIQKTCADCPRLKRDEEVSRPATRYGGLRYSLRRNRGKEWTGEVVWRSVHPSINGAPITTHVMIEERPSFTRLTVRVTADEGRASVRGYVGAGSAEPAFLRTLGAHVTPFWMGGPFAAHTLHDLEVERFVADVLSNPARDVPVVVLAPNEDGTFVVNPDVLLWELLGRARLYVIHDHRITYRLSDTLLDRRLSCYWGAARCYFPDFTTHDDPRDHPLLVAERLADPLMRATWLGEIGMATIGMSLRDAFSDLGIDYRSAIARGTSAKHREQYRFRQANGSLVEAEEHIVLGNTYDPRRCLRIYFSSRVPNESRLVIAHVGRHFDVKRTT